MYLYIHPMLTSYMMLILTLRKMNLSKMSHVRAKNGLWITLEKTAQKQ